MQINRLFEIVYLLMNKQTVTAKELAAYFEVSRRTILRDVETLSQAGIPIYTTPGKGGGISILENFVFNKAALSEEEQNQILFALQSFGTAGHTETDDILAKMRLLFDKADVNWIEADFSRWGNTAPDKEMFQLLKQAILQKQALAFAYASSYGEVTDRTVYPLKLVFKSKAWYLQAFCLKKEDYRTFKVNRMLRITVLQESFAGKSYTPPPIDYGVPPPACLEHLVLKLAPQAAYRVYDEFDSNDVTRNPDGSFLICIDMPDDSWLYGFLLSFGATAEVISPAHVRSRLLEQIKLMQSFYCDSNGDAMLSPYGCYDRAVVQKSYGKGQKKMNEKYCQSCGMPMGSGEELYGTEADGSKSADYCKYCYENGKFSADCTMDEMIEFCVPHMASSGMSEAEARSMMHKFFPELKRWKKN